MANKYFRFKQFAIQQETAAFMVTTDSVLLGAWAQIEDTGTILDIGTGTGLLALMAAQRSAARIVAIEPDNGSFVQAGLNFAASPWNDRITLLNISVQKFMPEAGMWKERMTPVNAAVQDFYPESGKGFDAIIVNPPILSIHCLIRMKPKPVQDTL